MVDPDRQDIEAVLQESKVLVLPSKRTPTWREQIGLPILEGLSFGCEIVTTEETGIADWLRYNGHQVLEAKHSSSDLAKSILLSLTNGRSAEQIQSTLPPRDSRTDAEEWLIDAG